MKFYNYGDKNSPVIMLLPGTCCHWSMFSKAVSLLKDTFRVICVSYDGFDETQPELTFPSIDKPSRRYHKLEALHCR